MIACKTCENAECYVQKYCGDEWLSLINLAKDQRKYRSGEYVFREGSPVHGIHFIKKGSVKIVSGTASGRMQIVRLATEGHILGHRGYGEDRYPIGAIALSDSEICFVPNDILNNVFLSNPEFTVALMMFYSRELRISEQRNRIFGTLSGSERVAAALLYLLDTFGSRSDGTIGAEISQHDIGELAGTSVRHVRTQLAALREDKVVEADGQRYRILKPDTLRAAIGPERTPF